MARMYPDRIPAFVRTNPGRAAECSVYEALLDTLSDDYSVFGWVAWVGRRTGDGARDGEADFVIAHPEHGLLVLEVKGGAVAFDASAGAWSSTDLNGRVHPLQESPFAQAARHRHELGRKLQDTPKWGGRSPTFGWAVALPDSSTPAGDLGLDGPRELLICHEHMGRIDERVASIGRYWQRREEHREPLGEDGVHAVRQVLAQSFQLRMPLGRVLQEDARSIVELSEAQFGVLDGLVHNRRVLVTGGAGTGKTLLALEKAKRLARDDGFRTLLTCFNLPLAEYLRASAGDIPLLTVRNFHELCSDFAQRAGHDVTVPTDGAAANIFYRETLPTLLADALTAIPDRFDAIVLDEGQDFSATDRAALEMTLDDRADSILYAFQDDTQAIYPDGSPWPATGMATFVLTENRRNTRAIHEVLGCLAGDTGTRAGGPPGTPQEFIVAREGREQARALSRVLHRLIKEQGVAPASIAVLVSSRRGEPPVVVDGRIGAFEATTEHDAADERILFESVTRFKGLERDVVILTRLDPVEYISYRPMLYVGASRARTMLIVIGDEETLRHFGGVPPAASADEGTGETRQVRPD